MTLRALDSRWDAILELAVHLAYRGGAMIRERSGRATSVEAKDTVRDLVTEVDKAVEEMVRAEVAAVFPGHQVLGEESVAPGASASALARLTPAEHLWIVDPIDGTTNFVHGLPCSVISIAVASRGQVVVGVIYDPHRGELFLARRGKGAFLNGRPLRVSREARLCEAVVATGFPSCAEARVRNARALAELAPRARSFRTFGSAALHLAYVAAGRLSGFWELNLCAWDVAAGSLLVEEAGGRVGETSGGRYALAVRDIVASNGIIHDELVRGLGGADTMSAAA